MKVYRNLTLLFFSALICSIVAQIIDNCFTSKDTFECRLGAKSPYRFVANKNDSELRYAGCEAKKIWLFVRHGTRYPGKNKIIQMTNKLPEILSLLLSNRNNGTLSKHQMEEFQEWKFTFSSNDAMKLTSEGERELVGIAERFQSRFPKIMPELYSNLTYAFKYTDTQRAKESAENFALGLFGRKQSLNVWYPEPTYNDPILRFYKLCKHWKEKIKHNPETYKEKDEFLRGPIVNELLTEVSNRAGFEMNFDDVYLVYTMCAFETAWNVDDNSPWCNLFSLKNFKVLEYVKDLQYYWTNGYGYPLTYEQACITMRDMFDFFESKDEIKTTAYFTHSGALLKFLTLLGLAKDEIPLRHDSFYHHENRAWRMTLIDSFASNLAFILYDCESRDPGILLMHQERVVQLPDCPLDYPCPLSIMREKFTDTEDECQFNEMCGI